MGLKVYYDEGTGDIAFTLRAADGFRCPKGPHLDLEMDDIPDPSRWKVVDGQLTERGAEILPLVRAEAVDRVNAAAGDRRARIITVATGQQLVYLQKEAEASAFLSEPGADLARFPLISAEIGITGATGEGVAQVIMARALESRQALAAIETARLSAIATINTAEDEAAVQAAVAVFLG